MTGVRTSLVAGFLAALSACAVPASSPPPNGAQERFTNASVAFSAEQARRGETIFARHCASCHTPKTSAELMVANGAGMRLDAYHERLSGLMPPLGGERPDAQGYLDVVALLLRETGVAPGEADAEIAGRAWRAASVPDRMLARTAPLVGDELAWTAWRGDNLGRGYSAADQITRENVGRLAVAWRWSSANNGPSAELRNITTPLMAEGKLYATAGVTRNVVAIDARSGETLWMWRAEDGDDRFNNAPRKGAGRGVAWWSDGNEARIFTVTPGFRLAALDARTGRPVAGFGERGVVDLMTDLRNAPEGGLADIGSQSPPLVAGDVVIVGPAHLVSFRPRLKQNVKGDVRGYDARTGKLLWTFHTIPEPGEPGYETWERGAAERTGNGGVWAPMTYDAASGAVFLPVEAGTSDLYGGERLGANLNTSSLVSLDARTGEVRWVQQLVHHDIWDWDVPATPILADVPAAGGARQAVLQITKQGFVFAFDRNTGEPLWPVEERAVPKSDMPGEVSWPTQPMPTLPEPFDRQGVTPDDLIDFTPELHAEALELAKRYRMGAFMAPASLANAADGTNGTLTLPSLTGGGNWEGGAYDPDTGMLYVGSATEISRLALQAAPEGSAARYVMSPPIGAPRVQGLPMVKPPYGRITALDMTTGRRAWTMANADTPASIANHPALAGIDLPRTGVATRAGLLATKTLLFAGEGESGGHVLRAHDKATGEIIAEIALPGAQMGLPMSYVLDGRQYVALAVGDGEHAAEIVALALPR